jgi:L-fucose isomerase
MKHCPGQSGSRSHHHAHPSPGSGPFKDVYSVMAAWGANHGADQVYRPSYWNAFGMDTEGSDYRACEALGPMYK